MKSKTKFSRQAASLKRRSPASGSATGGVGSPPIIRRAVSCQSFAYCWASSAWAVIMRAGSAIIRAVISRKALPMPSGSGSAAPASVPCRAANSAATRWLRSVISLKRSASAFWSSVPVMGPPPAMVRRKYSPRVLLRCSIKLSQCGIAALLAGCAVLGDTPPSAGRLADEERIRRERPWPNLADVPAEPRPGSDAAAIAALRAKLEAERTAQRAAPACPPDRAGKDRNCTQ